MKPKQTGKRLCLAALATAALLAACHHHDDDHDSTSTPPVATNPPPAASDAFFSYVSQVVATQSDTAEPASTDGVTVTAPEDTEPLPLPGP